MNRKGKKGEKLKSLDDLLTPIKKGDYGPVKIVAGEYAGQLGNYDDEADDEGLAIVYLHGTTIADEHPHIAQIKHSDLRKSDVIDPFSRDMWYAMRDTLQRVVWAHDGNVKHGTTEEVLEDARELLRVLDH